MRSDLLKLAIPRIKRLNSLEEEIRRLKEEVLQMKGAAQGECPESPLFFCALSSNVYLCHQPKTSP